MFQPIRFCRFRSCHIGERILRIEGRLDLGTSPSDLTMMTGGAPDLESS